MAKRSCLRPPKTDHIGDVNEMVPAHASRRLTVPLVSGAGRPDLPVR